MCSTTTSASSCRRSEGPQAALSELDTGIAFATACGLTEVRDLATLSRLDPLIDAGRLDEAFDVAQGLAARLEVEAPGDLVDVRAAQLRIHTIRGTGAQAAEWLEWLESTAREIGHTDALVIGLGCAAMARAALSPDAKAAALLEEIAGAPETRESEYYAAYLPGLVRSAIAIGDPVLAERFTTGLTADTPYSAHALVTATAALAEARDDLQAAANAYADAAARWERFGVVPEQGYALLGYARCLVNGGQLGDADAGTATGPRAL